jgi:uncharacterized OsmC-like protein
MSTDPDATDRLHTFDVTAAADSATRTTVSVRDFEFVVDEPPALGGTDEGPNPVEYLLGALAGCLNVVAHTVADEMDLEVRDLSIDLEGDLDPAKFAGRDDDPRAGYQAIRVDVSADVDADPETIDAWLSAVEERCPVSDNLGDPTPVDVDFSPA